MKIKWYAIMAEPMLRFMTFYEIDLFNLGELRLLILKCPNVPAPGEEPSKIKGE